MISQTVPTLLRDRHTIPRRTWDALIPLVTLEGQQPTRNPIDAAEKYPKNKNKETRREQNIRFNEIRQFAYVLVARERDFIDLTINYKLFLEDF